MQVEQTEIVLDGEAFYLRSELSFFEASNELKQRLGTERVVTEIFLDEKPIDIEQENGLQTEMIRNLGKLRFESKEIGVLLKDSLQLAPLICESLQQDCFDIDHLFKASNFSEANERIAEFSSLVDWILQMVSSLQSYGAEDFRQLTVDEVSVIDLISRTDTLLKSLHQKLQQQDYAAFQEVLVNEFHPELFHWKKIFEKAALEWNPKSKTEN